VARTSRLVTACAAALLLALPACGDDGESDTQQVSSPTPAATSTPGSPTAAPTSEPTTEPAETEQTEQTAAVAVYYVMDTTNGPRLYREFHRRPVGDDPVRDAVQAMIEVPADDPDYTSLWPTATQVRDVTREGDLVTVDLSAQALGGNAGSSFEQMSVQQLVHTVTAAEPEVRRVQLTVDGQVRESLWGAVSIGEPIRRAPAAEVLGPVWILNPPEAGTLAAGEQFGGVATVFEATVNWQWLRDGKVVAEGFSTATEGAPGRGEWSAAVDVPPGDYELKAFESSAKDGSETFVDTKRVTVTG
jgi:spore germination protein GerM